MELTGQGEGFDSPQGRAEAAARAVFDAFSAYRSADLILSPRGSGAECRVGGTGALVHIVS